MNPEDRTIRKALTPAEWEWIKAMRSAQACASKAPYETQAAALRAAIQRTQRFDRNVDYLSTYQCPSCNLWHLTRQKPPSKTSPSTSSSSSTTSDDPRSS